MKYSIKIKRGENIIYVIIWLIILLMPVFITNSETGVNWNKITSEWIRVTPFFIVFMIHNSLLFPKFFVQKKRTWYFLLTFSLIIVAAFIADMIGNSLNLQPGEPMHMPHHGDFPPMGQKPPRPQPWTKVFIDNFLVSTLVVGFNAAIKLTVKWQDEEQKNKELEKEKLASELAFLRNQVSPHFFMNTLNNIHALVDINTEEAKESIIQLSKLMRHLLYESESDTIPIRKEVDFIKNYVDLMKLRYSQKVRIDLHLPAQLPDKSIPPLLFTSYLENAFKHGISYQNASFIDISISCTQEILTFEIRNSNPQIKKEETSSGIGIENSRKRLDLVYGDKYSLNIENNKDDHFVSLTIPL